jgi:hypothetical protein
MFPGFIEEERPFFFKEKFWANLPCFAKNSKNSVGWEAAFDRMV